MINATGKTLPDYFSDAARKASTPFSGRNPDRPFGAVLRQTLSPGTDSRIRQTGLTIKDYLAAVRPKIGNSAVIRQLDPSGAPSVGPEVKPSPSEALPSLTPPIPNRHAGDIEESIREASLKYGLPEALIRSVIRHESNFQADAVSPAGAQGLMQLMPATARELGVGNPFDIHQNINGGARYLRQMVDLFDGDLEKALAAYNAGPGNVKRYNGVPPYPETRTYVNRVLSDIGPRTETAATS